MPVLFHRHFTLGTILYTVLILCLAGLLVSYGAFQARTIIAGPTLTLTTEPETPTQSATQQIQGVAQNIVLLTLNGRQIFTDDTGAFSETLVLPMGYTIVTLSAKDRYGRETTLTRTLVRTE